MPIPPLWLRHKRESQQKTREEAAMALHITVETLNHLESHPYETWPWPEHIRIGLLSSYAAWLGLDPIHCLRYRFSFRMPEIQQGPHKLNALEYGCIILIGLIGFAGLWLR